MRLDKYLTLAQMGTRSEVKKIIRSGRVFLNGVQVKKADEKVESEDEVMVDGMQITYETYEYFMLHKPAGVVSATRDKKDRTVVDLITCPHKKDIFPVGRLDKDTEGLLILTNDGAMAHELLSPSRHVKKTYFVRILGELNASAIEKLENGLDIGDDKPTKPAVLSEISTPYCESGTEIYTELCITITEGRYHQIKRMFAKVGNPVMYLKRISMGGIVLDEKLEKGAFRKLTEDEVRQLSERNKSNN